MSKQLAHLFNIGHGGGIFRLSDRPKEINPKTIKNGDIVVLWDIDGLAETDLTQGGKYIVEQFDADNALISIKQISENPLPDESVEAAWIELRRFCLPEHFNSDGIFATPAFYESGPFTEFAGRKVMSRLHFPIDSLGIPIKKLRMDLFAELFHPQFLFQYTVSGDSRLYLTSYEGNWLLIQRQYCDLRCELEYIHKELSIALMMPKLKGDRKSDVAKLLFALWIFHFPYGLDHESKYEHDMIAEEYTLTQTWRKGARFVTRNELMEVIKMVDNKTYKDASGIVENYIVYRKHKS